MLPKLEEYYLAQYCKFWENIIKDVKITPAAGLIAIDQLIVAMLQNHKALLGFADAIYFNTNLAKIDNCSDLLMKFNTFMGQQISQDNNAFAGLLIDFYKLHDLLEHNINNPLSSDRNEVIKLSKNIKRTANTYPEPFKTWVNTIVYNLEQSLGVAQ